jgi:predicted adenylyl cyclase CyaB
MGIEYEYSFYNFNKKDVINKIKKEKGKKKGIYLFRVQVLIHPLETPGTYIRVRDEGHRITMTYKFKDSKSKFENENEVIVNDFDEAVNILLGIGCTKKYYYEKMREIWNVKKTEIVFDSNPGVPDRMEIESENKNQLNEMVKYFDVKPEEISDKYMELFGFTVPKTIDLTFKNVKKDLLKLVKKNKNEFIKLVDDQLTKYKKIVKKSTIK